MFENHLARLEKGGLSSAEAQVYLALVRSGTPMSASAIVTATGVPRGSIYPTLTRLTDMGLVEAEAGYGGRFSAVPAESALPSLIVREREELSQREKILGQLARELKSVAELAPPGADGEVIQVLRDPRVATDRFQRLQLEAQEHIDVFVKAPFFASDNNPAEEEVLKRGIRYRALYERAALDSPEIRPFLETWVSKGEEARIYDGELPHKLAIFDQRNILLPLITLGGSAKTLFIRHAQLATSLGMLFGTLWEHAEPILPAKASRSSSRSKRNTESRDPMLSKAEHSSSGGDGKHSRI